MSSQSLSFRRCFFACVLALLPLTVLSAQAAPALQAQYVDGSARFTVITPSCVRLEYAPSGQFVNAPSLFAAVRPQGCLAAKTAPSPILTIDTGEIKLTYTPNGQPFSPANLYADIKRGAQAVRWTPGAPNPGNLGGTIRTLDGADGPEDLGQGLLSRDGWFLLDDSHSPLLTSSWVQARPTGSGTDWYLFGYGNNYRAALKSLTAVGGPVPLTRKYALGAWYSRYWPYTEDDYHALVQQYASHDFPLDNMVLDMDWHRDGWTGWSWNRKLLPHAEALLSWLHGQGLHVTLNLHPADGVGPQEDQYTAFMRDMGADPATRQTIPFDAADPKYVNTLFSDVFTPLEHDGIDFWWLDWQQYEQTRSLPGLTNLFWLNTLLFDRTAQNKQRGLSFSRWAGWGDHRHPIHFSGDASTSFAMLAFEVPFTATAGNVGCFFWSHDIGGHNRGRNEESYARWVQFGAVSPVLRSHSTRDATMDRRPWLYPPWATASMRASFHLRDTLFPYIYTSAAESCRETVPLDRPLYLDHPTEEAAYHNAQEFLLGDSLLAAPIVSPGIGPGWVGTQTVWFPSGTWYNTFTGERYFGNANALAAADISEFPLYVRGGVPIPMQPYTPRMATAPLTTLRVRCFPGPDGKTERGTLYEDDGVTTAYQRGQSATTPLAYTRRGGLVTVTVGAAQGHYSGQPARRSLMVELPDTARAAEVKVNGLSAACAYNSATWTNFISVPLHSLRQAVTVTLRAAPAGFDALRAAAVSRRIRAITGKPAATVEAALTDPALTPAQQEALLAVAGVGLAAHNEGAYLYHGTIQNELFAPGGAMNVVTSPAMAWRGREAALPAHAAVTLGGRAYLLPLTPQADAILTPDNVTRTAHIAGSGAEGGYTLEGAVDGVAGGYPDSKDNEWSAGSKIGAALTLTWDTPQIIDHVALYDRPNANDQVTAGMLKFSDGSSVPFGPLPDDGKTPLDLRFPAKTITALTFEVTGVKPSTENAGLSEIAVFKAKPGFAL